MIAALSTSLLCGILDDPTVTLANWQTVQADLLKIRLEDAANPLAAVDYPWISVADKAKLLLYLCELRLREAPDVGQQGETYANVRKLDAASLRLSPIGEDADGNRYWYFAGMRLYREGGSVAGLFLLCRDSAIR